MRGDSEPLKSGVIIWFGKHKGKDLDDVPADYLLWFAEQKWSSRFEDILGYIDKNYKAIVTEAEGE